MVDYTALATTAKTLIDANGRDVTFIKFDQTPDDGSKPWRGPTDPRAGTTVSRKSVFVPPSSATKMGLTTEQSDLVRRSQQIAIVAAAGTAEDLSEYQEVLDGSEHWKITVVETLKPADTTLLYIVGVAR